MEKENKEKNKAFFLIRLMGRNLALRFIETKIIHWKENEFKEQREKSLSYWESVKSYIV